MNKIQKKAIGRKLGHYPVKLLKGSKACCVCDDVKKKKSRFKCEKCSDTYSRDIAICVQHFRQFHENMHKYIPKGVRKGAYENEIQKFKGSDGDKTGASSVVLKKKVEGGGMNKEYMEVMQKWDRKSERSDHQLTILANIFYHEKRITFNDQGPGCYDSYGNVPYEVFYHDQHYYQIKNEVIEQDMGIKIEQQR